ncbi:MAG TPA: phytoene/squalene synthase family protein [Mucilaginibacter sp.]|jgi:phytoene synthase|nr:phytoene/squalene synthase family protein [Mucilaginibacter sp.]
MTLYNDTCFEGSKLITNKYSTSFSKGINAFDKRFRYPIYAIYGFVRYADEIVDTFHGHDQHKLINDFKEDAFKAIGQKISLNPVLQSFQLVVNEYHIESGLIEAFLSSMEMDLDQKVFNGNEYKNYIYGSAEVIGLMCLRVFCEGDEELYNRLVPSARKLGSALQKINFLRDIKADYHERGRIYFPDVDFNNFTDSDKGQIETDIQKDLSAGFKGIKELPKGARLGVYIAYMYYRELLKKIIKTPASVIMQRRIRITDVSKNMLYLKAISKHKLGMI